MCGRYSLTATPEEVRALFGYDERPNFPPRYNIAPTQPIGIVRWASGTSHFSLARWGLVPGWAKDPADLPLLINARSETAHQKPAFRGSMRHHRCLIPANGFYEWRRQSDGHKQPFWIAPADGRLIAFAGLWSDWLGADGSEFDSAAILTCEANETLAPIHNRMPVVISPENFSAWLDVDGVSVQEARGLLKPAQPDFFEAVPVSSRVNKVANDDEELQVRAEPDANAAAPARPRKSRPARAPGGEQFDLF